MHNKNIKIVYFLGIISFCILQFFDLIVSQGEIVLGTIVVVVLILFATLFLITQFELTKFKVGNTLSTLSDYIAILMILDIIVWLI
ncbi:MAG: hypothetical protein RBQ97_06890 [Acholeplasma sp.]|nr:hypothetical protein [Acholeplasma sp.]